MGKGQQVIQRSSTEIARFRFQPTPLKANLIFYITIIDMRRFRNLFRGNRVDIQPDRPPAGNPNYNPNVHNDEYEGIEEPEFIPAALRHIVLMEKM